MSITVLASQNFHQAKSVTPNKHSTSFSTLMSMFLWLMGIANIMRSPKATNTYPAEIPIVDAAEPNGRRGREDYVDQPTCVRCGQDTPVHWLQLLAAAGLTSASEGPHPTK